MIREMMIDAELYHVDERLCGVNDMTFEEWEQYQDQMLKYNNVYQYENGPYEEDEDNSSEEDDSSEKDESSDEDKSSDKDDEWDENHRSCHCNDDPCLSKVTSSG